MIVLVIDGQGGNIGKQIVKSVALACPEVELLAVGTNSIATENMIKAGAQSAATGENAVIVASRRADVIIGPIGIVIADALMGEVTPSMSAAVGQSAAEKILIPITKCHTEIAGIGPEKTSDLIDDAVKKLKRIEASFKEL